jgi:formate dehydrogenase subunit gamma
MPANAISAPETMRSNASKREQVLRFRQSERQLHWALAVPFMVCYATAMILVTIYNPNPTRPYRDVVSWAHRMSGVCLIVLPLWTAVRHRRDLGVHLYNIRQAWVWRLDDLKWLCLMGPAAVSSKISLPDQGKFNAGEKINFMVLMATYPFYIMTGILIWLPGVAFLSWLVHVSMAMIATPLLIGHLFMALVNPSSSRGLGGMISGFVDRQWARHHYRRWYDEHFGDRADATEPLVVVKPGDPCPVLVRSASFQSDRPATSLAYLHDSVSKTVPAASAQRSANIDTESGIAAPQDRDWIVRRVGRDILDVSLLKHRDVGPQADEPHLDDMALSENDMVPVEQGT